MYAKFESIGRLSCECSIESPDATCSHWVVWFLDMWIGKGAEGFGPISTNTTGLKVGLNICKDGILCPNRTCPWGRGYDHHLSYEPNLSVQNAIHGGCWMHGNMDMGWLHWEMSSIVLLVTIYAAAAGRSDLNANLQQQRKETGVKKWAVCTWIEVNIGHIHWDGFQMTENLCKTKGVVWAYEWIVGYQMHDVDKEEKVFLYIYSTYLQKLAISFWLINNSSYPTFHCSRNNGYGMMAYFCQIQHKDGWEVQVR